MGSEILDNLSTDNATIDTDTGNKNTDTENFYRQIVHRDIINVDGFKVVTTVEVFISAELMEAMVMLQS